MFGSDFRVRRTTIIGFGLLAFLLGLGISWYGEAIDKSWFVVAMVFILLGVKKKGIVLLVSVMFFGLITGWLRGNSFLNRLETYEQLYGEKIVLQARAQTDAVYGFRSQLEFDADQIELIEPVSESMPGKLKISGFGANAVNRGDVVRVEGKLQSTLGSRQGRVSFADIVVIGQGNSVIETTRRKFVAGMQTALPEPLASFAIGLLVGQRTTLPESTTDNLAAVGLTHIIAVSGYNLTIIMRAVRRGLGKRSKYQVTIISAGLMIAFLLVTGFSASIVRAAIVSGLSLIAWYYGRSIKALLIILLAAAITAGWYPIYIWTDLGWYLSFLAFFGVLILAPLLIKRLYGPHKEPKLLAMVAIESLCAQIMTVPLILWVFKELSVVAPVSNILIVPLVPLAMLLVLVAGLGGMLLPALAGWFAWPAKVLLTYMLDVVSVIARTPHALVSQSLTLVQMLCLYGLLGFLSFVLWRKTKNRHATITDTETI